MSCDRDKDDLPSVSIIIVAHNEENVIDARIQNALAVDYLRERIEIAVASDGSSDATNGIILTYADRGVRIFAYEERRGKAQVLNDVCPLLSGEILVFSDANTEFQSTAVRKLVRWFSDPLVGVVCGQLNFRDRAHGSNVDSLYWKYESIVKRSEGSLGALSGANGAIYALRANCFYPLPVRTTVDDLMIPLLARMAKNCMIVYDSQAIAWEQTAANMKEEFRRRCRNGAGGYQSLFYLARLLQPRYGWMAFTFLSHKVGRWIVPFCLLVLLGTNVTLASSGIYRAVFYAQLAFYVVAFIGAVLPSRVLAFKPIKLCTMFCVMNLALMCGLVVWLLGKQRGTWRPTSRNTLEYVVSPTDR